jgi:hypothetical protein
MNRRKLSTFLAMFLCFISLFDFQFQACIRKAGEVRRPPAVLRDRPTHRNQKASRKFCLPVKIEVYILPFSTFRLLELFIFKLTH